MFYYNDKQNEVRRFDRDYRPKVILCDGAIGSGKTRIVESCWITHQWEVKERNQDHILTGFTLSSLERNILRPLHDNFEIDTNLDSENTFELWGNRYYCFGTSDAHAWKAIRGIETAYSHYGNEVTLSHKDALDEVANRLRGKGARSFLETNPEGEDNLIYKRYISPSLRNGNNEQLARFNFTMWDNDEEHGGFLPKEYIKQQEERYTGILRRKYLNGEWCSIEGQIYYTEQLQYYDDSITKARNWFIGTIIHGYLDPAAGSTKKTGCYTSIITAALKDDKIYILDVVVRKYGVTETIKAVGERLTTWNYSRFAYEDNFTQEEYVGRPLKQAYPYQNISGQSSREDKISRLIGMHHTVMTKVFFPERFLHEKGSDGWLLLQQLCNITKDRNEKAETDEQFLDAPDALEGLIRTFRNYSGGHREGPTVGGDDVRSKQEW